MLASHTMPFMSARCGIIRLRFTSNRSSPRLLAPSPHVYQSRGRLRRSVLTAAGRRLSFLSARLPICPLRSASIRPASSTRLAGRTTGRLVPVLGAVIRSACPFDCVGAGDGDDFILCPVALDCLDCLPAILRLPGNTSAGYAGRHGVGSRSRLIVSPPVSYPLLFRILSTIAPSRCPVLSHPSPVSSHQFRSPACFILIAPLIAQCHHNPIIRRGAPCCFRPIAYRPSRPACRVE